MRVLIDLIESQKLSEAGAGAARIAQHIRDGREFIAISAFRANLPMAENQRRTEVLKAHLSKMPVSYIVTGGEYQEIGQEEPSEETSFFVTPRQPVPVEQLVGWGKKLRQIFSQDAFIYGDGESIRLHDKSGDDFEIGDRASFNPASIRNAAGFTTVKGKAFTYTDGSDVHASRAVKYGGGKA